MNTPSLDFFSHIELNTEHIRLRPLVESDGSLLLPAASYGQLWTYTTTRIENKSDLDSYILNALTQKKKGQRYPFIILNDENGEAIGSTSYLNYVQDHGRIEIGYTWIGKAYQGTGVNEICKFLLLQHAFETLKVIRVELKTDVLNLQARKALQKIGAKEEGILRSHTVMHDGRRRDTIYYSILSEEWEGIKRRVFQEIAFK